jgi:hypothetical protein
MAGTMATVSPVFKGVALSFRNRTSSSLTKTRT